MAKSLFSRSPGLRKNVTVVPLSTPVDAGQSDPHSNAATILASENVYFPRDGAVAKRPGCHTTYASGSYGATDAIAEFNGKPSGFDLTNSIVRNLIGDPEATGCAFVPAGSGYTQTRMIRDELVVTPTGEEVIWCDHVVGSYNRFVVWSSPSGANHTSSVQAFSKDSNTATIARVTGLATSAGSLPRLTRLFDGRVVLAYVSAGTLYLAVYTEASQTSTTSAGHTPAMTYPVGNFPIAICPFRDAAAANYLAVAYRSSATNQICAAVINADTGAEVSALTSATYASPTTIDMSADADAGVLLVWGNATGFAHTALNTPAALAAAYAPATTALANIARIVCGPDQGQGLLQRYRAIWVETRAAGARPVVSQLRIKDGGGVVRALGELFRGQPIVSKMGGSFGDDTANGAWTGHQGGAWWPVSPTDINKATAQRCYFRWCALRTVLETEDQLHIGAMALPGRGINLASLPSPTQTWYSHACASNLCPGESGSHEVSLIRYNGPTNSSIVIVSESSSSPAAQVTKAPGTFMISGAVPRAFDGSDLVPQALLEYPEGVTVANVAGGGSWPSLGSVGFRVIYEMTDNLGRIVKSATSPTVSYALAATTDKPQLTIPTFQTRSTATTYTVNIVVYMTDVNGDVFYRKETIANNRAASTVTSTAYTGIGGIFTTTGDSIVSVSEPLYTTGGILDVTPPTPHRVATVWQNRVFFVDSENPESNIGYTREFVAGTGVMYSDLLRIAVEAEGGEITCLRAYNDRLVIFKKNRIYMMHGQGPDATGGNAAFSRPRLIADSSGCPSPRGAVVTPVGLMYMSSTGVCLLTDGEQVMHVGRPVKYYTDRLSATSLALTAAAADPSRHIAAISCYGVGVLIYDYVHQKWAIWTETPFQYCTDLAYIDGHLISCVNSHTQYFVSNSDAKYTDDPGLAGGTSQWPYSMRVDTGWFSVDKVGEFRLYKSYIQGYNIADATLSVKFAYNWDPTWHDGRAGDAKTLDLVSLQNFSYADYFGNGLTSAHDDQAMLLQVRGSKQRVKSVRLSISDAATADGSRTRAFELTNLILVIGDREIPALVGDGRKV